MRQVAWRWSVAASSTAARISAERRVLPDFVIVGAQRCGTTSLAKALWQHPNVLGPRMAKGVHFFDTGYEHRLTWYRSHFPTRASVARRERRLGGPVKVGEASPYYLFHPAVAQRIVSTLPEACIVVVLRDPVERSWSQFHHERERGFEKRDFLDAIEAEPTRLAGVEAHLMCHRTAQSFEHQHHSYLARGDYVPQLTRYLSSFGRDRVLVLFSEELFANPNAQLATVQRFLGVPEHLLGLPRENASKARPIPDVIAAELRDRFANSDAELSELLGRPLPWRSGDLRS